MMFLPITYRELRAASRRKGTFRIRSAAAFIAATTTAVTIGFSSRTLTASALFSVVSVCAFGLCLMAGVFLTSDALSEEKREGTLGFLFLADLDGRQIIFGKFLAISLNAFFALFALLPIIAFPILLGGVTWWEYVRVSVVLLNTLFFSLSLGIFVSSFSRIPSRALGGSLALVLVLTFSATLLAQIGYPLLFLRMLSPLDPFVYASDAEFGSHHGSFYVNLLVINLLAWIGLGLGGYVLRHWWQERCIGERRRFLPGLLNARSSNVRKIRKIGKDSPYVPMHWLVGDALWLRCLAWLLVCGWAVAILVNWGNRKQMTVAYIGAAAGALIFKVLFALQACRFFAESRRNGALELLLCTPLANGAIVSSQWHALRRLFVLPIILFLLLAIGQIIFLMSSSGGLTAPASLGSYGFYSLPTGAPAIFRLTFGLGADILAVGWFGMWLGLTMKRGNLATGLTILCVLIVPAMFSWLALVTDMLFISWGVTRLQEDVRWILSRQYLEPFAASPA